MKKNTLRSSSVLLAVCFLASPNVLASDDPNSDVKVFIKEGLATYFCADRNFLKRSGLNYDTCLTDFERVTPICWERIQLLIPDLRFGQSDFGDKENKDKVVATMFALQRCVQASILLDDIEEYVAQPDE